MSLESSAAIAQVMQELLAILEVQHIQAKTDTQMLDSLIATILDIQDSADKGEY